MRSPTHNPRGWHKACSLRATHRQELLSGTLPLAGIAIECKCQDNQLGPRILQSSKERNFIRRVDHPMRNDKIPIRNCCLRRDRGDRRCVCDWSLHTCHWAVGCGCRIPFGCEFFGAAGPDGACSCIWCQLHRRSHSRTIHRGRDPLLRSSRPRELRSRPRPLSWRDRGGSGAAVATPC